MMPTWSTQDCRQRKRGLGSWIGSGLAWTFGLAREKVNHNNRHIANEVNIALDSWHNIADDMRSYTVLNDRRVSNLAQAVNDTRIIMSDVENQIQTTRSEVSAMRPLIDALIKKLTTYVSLEDDYIMLFLAVADIGLLHSRLNPIIIPPRVLQTVLMEIKRELRTHYPRFRLLRHFVSDYYRMSDFLVTRHENRLFITLRIPITMSSSRYDFNRVEKFPVRVPDNQNMSTVLTDTTFGIGVPEADWIHGISKFGTGYVSQWNFRFNYYSIFVQALYHGPVS